MSFIPKLAVLNPTISNMPNALSNLIVNYLLKCLSVPQIVIVQISNLGCRILILDAGSRDAGSAWAQWQGKGQGSGSPCQGFQSRRILGLGLCCEYT